jgi:hypothetical protein
MRVDLKKLWLDEFLGAHHLCGLCGNTGIIDTRPTAISPAGFRSGGLFWCICPNGREMRKYGIPPHRARELFEEVRGRIEDHTES